MITEWPVFDPGAASLSDIYEYEVEVERPVDVEVDFQAEEETTKPMPSAWLVERCMTSAALRGRP